MKLLKKHSRKAHYCMLFFLLLTLFIVGMYLGSPFIEHVMNKHNHQRTFDIKIYDGTQVTFSVPSYLHTLPESEKKQTTDVFTHESLLSGLYTTDRQLNQYYYQTKGVDFTIGQAAGSYTENIPDGIIKQGPKEITIPQGKVLLYIYPGADGDGHGRGTLGSVHQGIIEIPQQTAVEFVCYDHSSGANISTRCMQILETIFKTIHKTSSLLPQFIQ